MTQEEKQLLLIDLCARLPYGVKVRNVKMGFDIHNFNHNVREIKTLIEDFNIKPYLRPMSSMTEEEQKEFGNLAGLWKDQSTSRFINCLPNLSDEFGKTLISEIIVAKAIDWLNANHFDYRGLIPMGLALEAPEGMY